MVAFGVEATNHQLDHQRTSLRAFVSAPNLFFLFFNLKNKSLSRFSFQILERGASARAIGALFRGLNGSALPIPLEESRALSKGTEMSLFWKNTRRRAAERELFSAFASLWNRSRPPSSPPLKNKQELTQAHRERERNCKTTLDKLKKWVFSRFGVAPFLPGGELIAERRKVIQTRYPAGGRAEEDPQSVPARVVTGD